ncbi:MAG TPA: cadherin-like beta sandwich domain-containing protein [Leptospiraceae bacterium]|nr:cadherin-like beta sandwich domain-containing protein [Leptospiraceae bacterium]HMY68740.1 cadherin-like beta sandwich domain-containing protein [Leptospiraceae bacterium]HNF25243.1 cadherin-like beta sandwich domain-containing protein [Leptospiraceae bacterium]HNH07479.1 cadherin-like beta sandwich domain-containing protein [Leptospiraceae bacterium]HNI24769.1 cadherin-like beta sandwich domain-containing protein [Leptospiraceae bacterium]
MLFILLFFSSCAAKKGMKFKALFSIMSSDCTLSDLKISAGSLKETFSSSLTSYTASVPNSSGSTTVTATAANSGASITVNGAAVSSGTASGSISLAEGSNTVTVKVTAQDASSRTYTITIVRVTNISTLSFLSVSSVTLYPSFSSAVTSYTASVQSSVSSITVTPTASDANASITVNGTATASGSASSSLSLNTGANTVTVSVTASDSAAVSVYTVTVYRMVNNVYRFFITSSLYDGNLGGASGADSKCSSDANKPNDGSTYKAFVGTSGRYGCGTTSDCTNPSENSDWVLKPNKNYARTDGTALFTSNAAGIFLSSGSMSNSFESGVQKAYWGGFSSGIIWNYSTTNCSDWTSSSSGNQGRIGLSDSTGYYNAVRDLTTTPNCNTMQYLLCAEQ